MLKKLFKSTGFTAALLILLAVSLFFNFKPETPLYSISVLNVEEGTDRVIRTIRHTIDTERDREAALAVLNVMWNIPNCEVTVVPERAGSLPDIVITRNIPELSQKLLETDLAFSVNFPDWAAIECDYNILLDGDDVLVYSDFEHRYAGQQCYILDDHSAGVLAEHLNYQNYE